MKRFNLSKNRIIIYSILLILLLILIYVIFGIANIDSKNNTTALQDINPSQRGYFVPPVIDETNNVYEGVISKNLQATEGSNIQYVLSDTNGNDIIYIYSLNHDLEMSVGVWAELKGVLDQQSFNGLKVLKVEQIKLK